MKKDFGADKFNSLCGVFFFFFEQTIQGVLTRKSKFGRDYFSSLEVPDNRSKIRDVSK